MFGCEIDEEYLMTPEEKMLHLRFYDECPYKDLAKRFMWWEWEDKVAAVLHVVRCREFTDWDPKIQFRKPNRMCEYNIAFFDLDEESKIVHGPLFRDIPPSRYYFLDESINVISIKVAESDVRYPVRIYGTVLARDLNDYRCVYLFKRGRDDPQLITRKNLTC
nr:unnamed protein product [Digitaria exilis]